jgi:uncharacterized membrane protein (UPF0127 family)
MRIINKSKNTNLADKVALADNPVSRSRGLLGRKSLLQGEALVIKPCSSIHTFFMRFPIDVIFVDRNNQIIKAISGLKPWRLTGIYFNAGYVVELPEGAIQSSLTSKGDTLILE